MVLSSVSGLRARTLWSIGHSCQCPTRVGTAPGGRADTFAGVDGSSVENGVANTDVTRLRPCRISLPVGTSVKVLAAALPRVGMRSRDQGPQESYEEPPRSTSADEGGGPWSQITCYRLADRPARTGVTPVRSQVRRCVEELLPAVSATAAA